MDISKNKYIGLVRINDQLIAYASSLYGRVARSRRNPIVSLIAEATSLTVNHTESDHLPSFAFNRLNDQDAETLRKIADRDCIRLTLQATEDELLLTFDLRNHPNVVTGAISLPFRKIDSALDGYRNAVKMGALSGPDGVPRFGSTERFRRYSHINTMRALFPGPINQEEAFWGDTARRIVTVIAYLFPREISKLSLQQGRELPAPCHPTFKYQDGYAIFDKACVPVQ